GLMNHLSQLVSAAQRYGICVEDPPGGEASSPGAPRADPAAGVGEDRLGSKMERLNTLLQPGGRGGPPDAAG
ncbi:unnamed protein product, partial [Prorocentrum cordatum]